MNSWFERRLGERERSVLRPQVSRFAEGASPKLKSDSRMIEGRLKLGGVRANAAAWDASSHESLRLQEGQNKPNSSPDQADRDALFREFVLWEALHTDAER